jgi:hypothetical protein
MSTDAKFKVQIMQKDKPLKVSKEVTDALKGVASPKTMGRMKKEAIFCPVANEEKPFLWCFACKSYIRRVKGVVDCAGGPAELDL